jgi:dienelactone hydrolase
MLERFTQMPQALRKVARWQRLGPAPGVPVMLVHPQVDSGRLAPVVIWMHGRTVSKEIDPGRYLRWMRAGLGACAIDLPGHGERPDPELQLPERTLDVVRQVIREIDLIVDALRDLGGFDMDRMGIGGMSAGGMAALARLCRPHPFRCVSVEATTGSWEHQRHRMMFKGLGLDEVNEFNPIKRLDGWREIPIQAIHGRHDEWVSIDGQREFLDALKRRYERPELVELIEYERTGAPGEHAGFGRMASDAKDRQAAFYRRWLVGDAGAAPAHPGHDDGQRHEHGR